MGHLKQNSIEDWFIHCPLFHYFQLNIKKQSNDMIPLILQEEFFR